MEQIITVTELSKKIGVNASTLSTYLCRFGKYAIEDESRYRYKYNYYFLFDLKQFFAKKMYIRNGQYFSKYHKVVENIKNLMEEM